MKKREDYLHLHLPFEFDFFGYKYKVIGFKDGGHFFTIWHEHGFFDVLKNDFKLPLRPLSDMGEEEMRDIVLVHYNMAKTLKTVSYDGRFIHFTAIGFMPKGEINIHNCGAETLRYLLSKHFDLFGLIEAGLAIDKTTLR